MQLKKELIHQIQFIIATAKGRAIRLVDTERELMYWSRYKQEQGYFRGIAGW